MRLLILACLLTAVSLAAADVTGKWRGSYESTNASGETRKGAAYLELKQEGSTVTGVAGPNENDAHQVKNGKFEQNKVTFTISTNDADMLIELTLAGDELTGVAKRDGDSSRPPAKLTFKREQ